MRPIILMYHSVTDAQPADPYGVSKKLFCDQISWLIDQEYQFVSLATLIQSRKKDLFPKRRKQVVLTFDDGCHDFLDNAFPILLGQGIPATVFLVANMLGQKAAWSKNSQEISLMTEVEVRQIKDEGVSLGSHTLTHADLTFLEKDELRLQLEMSRIRLVDFGETFFSFSYPWGKHTDREVTAVRAAGYACAVTADETAIFSGANPYRLGRLAMHRDLGLDIFSRKVVGLTFAQHIPILFKVLVRRMRKKVFGN